MKTPVSIVLLLGVIYFVSGIGATNVRGLRLGFAFITQFFPQCLAIYIIVDNRKLLQDFISLWVYIYFFSALITIKNGGRGPGDFTHDENDAALMLSMGIPIVFYAYYMPWYGKKMKWFCWLTLGVLLLGVIATSSRGGFLGLISAIGVLWFFSRNRVRNAFIGIVAAVMLSGIVFSLLPEGYIEDMQSINDTEDSTRIERFRSWEIAWVMYKHNPILGVGAGNFPWNAGKYQPYTSWWTGHERSLAGRQVHSLYFEILSDLGTIGAVVYLYIMFVMPFKLFFMRNRMLKDKELTDPIPILLCQAFAASMMPFIISGAFISVGYYPLLGVWITCYAIITRFIYAYYPSALAKKQRKKLSRV